MIQCNGLAVSVPLLEPTVVCAKPGHERLVSNMFMSMVPGDHRDQIDVTEGLPK
jgi:hypothetical protein